MIMDIEKEHKWDAYGERCIDCGDKDCFAGANCSNSKNIENAKYKIIVEPDAWASINQSVGADYKKVRYAKLPIQSLNPLMYKHEKLYSEPKVIGLLKAYYHDGYTEGFTLQEQEIQTLRAKVEVLVEALKYQRIRCADIIDIRLIDEALATYNKLSEVKHDTK